jgi:hypothetical protein
VRSCGSSERTCTPPNSTLIVAAATPRGCAHSMQSCFAFERSDRADHQRRCRSRRSRACLDQNDIARALPDLPTHMAGCKNLLILAGPTCARHREPTRCPGSPPVPRVVAIVPAYTPRSYVERLWTLLEIFVWTHMKEASNIRVLVNEDDKHKSSDIIGSFRTASIQVRSAHATCARTRARERGAHRRSP